MSEEQEPVNPLHEDFINSAPEELRDAAAELAPVWDQYVQSKFTEAADFRKRYEPFQELPMDQVTPEDIQDYLAFKQLSQDPQQLKAWHEQWDTTLRTQHPELFDEQGNYDAGTGNGGYTNDPVLLQRLEALEGRFSMEDQQRASQAAADRVTNELNSIKESYPSLTKEDEDAICALATKYVPRDGTAPPDDFIKRGFQDFQQIVGRTERELFTKKTEQPSPAQHGGRPATSPTPITNFESANEAARRAILEANRA